MLKFNKVIAGIIGSSMLLSSLPVTFAETEMGIDIQNLTTDEIVDVVDETSEDNTEFEAEDAHNATTILVADIVTEQTFAPAPKESINTIEVSDIDATTEVKSLMSSSGINLYADTVIANGKCGDNLTWTLDNKGSLVISGTGDMYDYSGGSSPFKKYSNILKSLTLEKGIESISNQAFEDCSGFTGNLILPDSLTSIGNRAFSGCSGFTGNLIIPDSVISIGNSSFGETGFDSAIVPVPNSITNINSFPFSGKNGLDFPVYVDCLPLTSEADLTVLPYNNLIFNKNLLKYLYDMTVTVSDQTYNGNAQTPPVSVTLKNQLTGEIITNLTSGTDYTVSYSNNTNAGTATVTITYKGAYLDYAGSVKSATFKIVAVPITDAEITVSECEFVGAPVIPEITIMYDGRTLIEGTDYIVDYTQNNSVGTGWAYIYGKGNYKDSLAKSFTITEWNPKKHNPIDMSLVTVSLDTNSFVYSGSAHEPKPALTYSVTDDYIYTLVEGVDYTIEYSNNINAGTALITLTGLQQGDGGFIKNITKTFSISKAEITSANIEAIANQIYCGRSIEPDPLLTFNSMTLVKDTDYTLSYSNNTNVGTAKVTIAGKGNFSSDATKTFTINPKSADNILIKPVIDFIFTGKEITPDIEAVDN